MQKQTLVVIIDNLQKGGAEVLLIGILPELNRRYDVVLVTLSGECDFKNDQIVCKEKYVLGFHGKLSFISCVLKLRKIIKKSSASIIHAHLFYSSLAARLACPSKIPLIYSVHNELSKNIFNDNKLYKVIEKITIRKNHSIIAVSKLVLEDYAKTIRLTKKYFILRNYIVDQFFDCVPPKREFKDFQNLRIIAIGNLKESKNYEYLLQSLTELKNYSIQLDIYGNKNHALLSGFTNLIDRHNLNVTFKGKVDNIQELFSHYDLYVMSSKYEGFGIAAVEAMSNGLPVLLSDIPVLREVTYNNALFFDLEDPLALANLIKKILGGNYDLNTLSHKGIEISKNYTRQKYTDELFSIYDNILQ